MGKYLANRLLRGLLSIVCVVFIVMLLVYGLMDRDLIFANDGSYQKQANNNKVTYMLQRWDAYGYIDYVNYQDYLNTLKDSGEITEEIRSQAVTLGFTASTDSAVTKKYVKAFTEYYESEGYTVLRLDTVKKNKKVAQGGAAALVAYRDQNIFSRAFNYFKNLITVDNIHNVPVEGEAGLTFTLYDPLYQGKFSPAIIGNGTNHKYLLYFDDQFPYIHQNLISIKLGTSYTINKGVDVWDTMNISQGSYMTSTITYPTGLVENSAADLHSAYYIKNSLAVSKFNQERFVDDYTGTFTVKNGKSKMGYSFIIGIISTVIAYVLGVPIGISMARNKDKFIDKVGKIYVIIIIAVPSLAYIFLFKTIGRNLFSLPTLFDVDSRSWLIYVLPVVSLSLPQVASLMNWLRRYMIDQMNSDYVKFARSSGLTENEIFNKHILKNAIIPLVHGVPSSILFSLTGAIVTERIYSVPGVGGVLTNAINKYDNGVIVGVALWYATLSVISIILGDALMSAVDPRISYTNKAR